MPVYTFDLLKQGKQINYDGAGGSVDFDKNGDVQTPIEIWKYSNGKIEIERRIDITCSENITTLDPEEQGARPPLCIAKALFNAKSQDQP